MDIIGDNWDFMIAHPPCTYLCSSGLHWNKRRPERAQMTEEALQFVRSLLDAPIPRIALENPIGAISTRIRKPDQTIQPYQYGHDASKSTCLWLKGLQPLTPTNDVKAEMMKLPRNVRERLHYLPPSEDRWKLRSETYEGIAHAMALQWGSPETRNT